jgi:hypothetical protein
VSVRRVFWLALAAYFLLGTAWALALPVNGTYDEKQHIVRAYAVASGQWLPRAGAVTVDTTGLRVPAFDTPRSLVPADADCTWYPKPPKPASCQRPVTDRTRTGMPSAVARYSPVYYLPVGLPLLVSPDGTGVLWARLVSVLLSAVLLAAAMAVAAWSRQRLLSAAIVVLSTPLAMNLNGSVNPNGLEISAGVLLLTCLLVLVRGGAADRRVLGLAGLGAVLLMTVRQFGPVLTVLAVLAAAVAAKPGRLRELLGDRRALLPFVVPAVVGFAFWAAWTIGSRFTDIETLPNWAEHLSFGQTVDEILTTRARFYVRQVVGQFGYGETVVSPLATGAWYLLFAALVVPALWFGDRRLRMAILGTLAAGVAILVALELYFVPRVGWFSHARYVMPLTAGVVLAAAFADRYVDWLDARGWLGRLVAILVLVPIPLELYMLARVMTRFQVGIAASLDPLGGTWHPPAGSILPLGCATVGAGLLAVTVLAGSQRSRQTAEWASTVHISTH